ncbi:hypothetical protein [Pimelobacter simplex]|uniref:hypothetical protein n=1 Tax=Nocardioides simplex TaxID=2045 RepID=UPI0019335E2F|nr:hypothetical protein [Pimelobacter simplex]
MAELNENHDLQDESDLEMSVLRLRAGGLTLRASAATVEESVNNVSTASLKVDPADLVAPVDLAGPIEVTVDVAQTDGDPLEHPLFTGHVTASHAEVDGGLSLRATAGIELSETAVGFVRTQHVNPHEEFYLIARLGGLPPERINAAGTALLTPETFVIEVPLQGIRVDRPIEVMGIHLLPLDLLGDGKVPWGPFTPLAKEIEDRWGKPTARARAQVEGRLMYEAEQTALQSIELALNGILATATYGLSVDPWNRTLNFERDRLRFRPTAIPIVYALGLSTQRRWIHDLPGPAQATDTRFGDQLDRWSALLQQPPSPVVARGLRALRDAADESRDVFDRCHALFSVLEYYAASVSMPPVVSKESRRLAAKAIKELALPGRELQVLRDAINQVNGAPLLAKVRMQAEQDRVPFNPSEWSLLAGLRRARNSTVHGRVADDAPGPDDIRWGVSIAARLLLHRWIAESAQRTGTVDRMERAD